MVLAVESGKAGMALAIYLARDDMGEAPRDNIEQALKDGTAGSTNQSSSVV